MKRANLVIATVAVGTLALLWLAPPVGFVAVIVMLVLAPPWGRSLAERGLISAVLLLGLVAVVFPRASTTPITQTSTQIGLTALLVIGIALRFTPPLANVRIPRPRVSDGLLAALGIGGWYWLAGPYLGQNPFSQVSGLFFTGWDNQGHFTAFANTFTEQATLWQTTDGSIAWNQWYPSLHTTTWALAQMGVDPTIATRIDLLGPFITWTSISFALCLVALAWMAGDLAERFAKMRDVSMAAAGIVAVIGFAAFALFGSPTLLFNAGFTNFMMAATITAVTGYLSARSWQSARKLGWFLIPIGALVVNALWTPMVLGLIIPGIIVLIALYRVRWWLAPIWAVASAAIVGTVVIAQTTAIVDADSAESAGALLEDLGQVGVGMTAFNIGAAIAFPLIALTVAIPLIRERMAPLAFSVLGPSAGITVFLIAAINATNSAGISLLQSYYVLKTLNAMLLITAPLIAALMATVIVIAVKSVGRVMAVTGSIVAALLGFVAFGYVGATPNQWNEGFSAAPGINALMARGSAVGDPLVGEAIINGAQAAKPYPVLTTLLWDGAGTLPNLWVSSLTTVMSKNANTFYRSLPPFPYDDSTVEYVNLALNVDPELNLAVLWFRGVSGDQLQRLEQMRPDRVTLVQVPMRESPLCQECPLPMR
jgi:hypothetical protein